MAEIREIAKEDLPKFRAVFSEVINTSFPEYPSEVINFFIGKDFKKSFLEKKISEWDYEVLLAIDKSKIVGFVVLEKMHGGVSFCDWLAVVKEYRGKGIGTLLLKYWENKIKRKGGHKLMLLNHSTDNQKFYQKNGFDKEGFEKKLWYGVDYWVYGKIIGQPNKKVFLSS